MGSSPIQRVSANHLNIAAGVVPAGGLDTLRDQIEHLASQPSQRLGFAMIASLVISLWSANGGMKAIFDALNVVYHEKERRSFIRLNIVSLTFTISAVLFMLMALATHHVTSFRTRLCRPFSKYGVARQDRTLASSPDSRQLCNRASVPLRP
jgi:uncharacterized BrkB/YihY/UPF0761 family membrane protein